MTIGHADLLALRLSSVGRLCRRVDPLRREDGGAAAIEFAFVLPLVITLLLGTIEVANIFRVQSEMTAAAREATRRFALDALTATEARSFVENRLAQVTDATVTVLVSATELESGVTDVRVDVAVPFEEIMLFGFDALITGASAGEGTDLAGSERTSESVYGDQNSVDTGDTGTAAAPCGPRLTASATMIKE